MSNETITVVIDPAGRTTIDVTDCAGSVCADKTQQLELVLGGRGASTKKDYKPEFSLPASTTAEVQTGGF